MKSFNSYTDAIRLDRKEFIKKLNACSTLTFGIHIIHISKNVILFEEYPRDRIATIVKKLENIKGKYIYLRYAHYESTFRYLIEINSFAKSIMIRLESFKYIKNLKLK